MEYKLLKFVPFREFEKWYVEYYLNTNVLHSSFEMISLERILTIKKERIKKNDYDGQLPVVSKIVFKSGQIIFRDENKTGMDLYKVDKGLLLISSINFHQGAIAYNDICDFVCSTHYQTYKINEDLVLPQFLVLVLRSSTFISKVAGIKANGIKNESGYDFISSFTIPVPSIDEQKGILQKYNALLLQAQQNDKQATTLEQSIDQYLCQTLDIQIQETKQTSDKLLQFERFKELDNWGINKILQNAIPEQLFYSSVYENIFLNELCEINPTTSLKEMEQQEISFLPMECISDEYGDIKNHFYEKGIKSKGYTKFKENDVIFAKITPCMENGKSAVVNNLKNGFGFGSTEFHVFRPRKDKLSPYYLHLLLRTKILRKLAKEYFTGSSGQQRVGKTFFENLKIPLPPLEIQQNIVKHIDGIKEQIKTCKQNSQDLQNQAKTFFENTLFSN